MTTISAIIYYIITNMKRSINIHNVVKLIHTSIELT